MSALISEGNSEKKICHQNTEFFNSMKGGSVAALGLAPWTKKCSEVNNRQERKKFLDLIWLDKTFSVSFPKNFLVPKLQLFN